MHSLTFPRFCSFPPDDQKEVEDIYINHKDYPELKDRDIVEIYDVEDVFSRLLVQIKDKSFKDEQAHSNPKKP